MTQIKGENPAKLSHDDWETLLPRSENKRKLNGGASVADLSSELRMIFCDLTARWVVA